MKSFKDTLLANLDGNKYTFIHHRASSELGQLLSPITFAPFNHPQHGRFNCVLGYIYWLRCGKPVDSKLRQVSNSQAIALGKRAINTSGIFVHEQTILQETIYATLLKIEEHCIANNDRTVTIKHELAGNSLPYIHVTSIRKSNDDAEITSSSKHYRVRILPEYTKLNSIYQELGKIYKTATGRDTPAIDVLNLLKAKNLFEVDMGPLEVV